MIVTLPNDMQLYNKNVVNLAIKLSNMLPSFKKSNK